MNAQGVFLLLAFLCASVIAQNGNSDLDNYVGKDDGCYSYSFVGSYNVKNAVIYTLNMTSLCWENTTFSNRYYWTHVLEIAVPTIPLTPLYGKAFLYINGGSTGSNGGNITTDLSVFYNTGVLAAELYQIPNEPVTMGSYVYNPLGGPNVGLSEDAFLARTFRTYLDSDQTDPSQIALFPMTKAAVKAMDTILNFTNPKLSNPITNFCVAGGSKRGWTTWFTAAVDKRVFAMAPIVAPLLNLNTMVNEVYRDYGNFGYALDDYTTNGVWDFMGTTKYPAMIQHVDPVAFIDRFTNIPKLVIDGTLDQFFIPDCPRNFWSQLGGQKFLALQANADHSLSARVTQVFDDAVVFFHSIAGGLALPTVTWQLVYSNNSATTMPSVTMSSSGGNLVNVTLWYANTHQGTRDFRATTCGNYSNPACFSGITWYQLNVPFNSQGANSSAVNIPLTAITGNMATQQWTGFYLEATYAMNILGQAVDFLVTTEANIYPDFYPFPAFVPNYTAIGYVPPSTTSTLTSSTTSTTSSQPNTTTSSSTMTSTSSTTHFSNASSLYPINFAIIFAVILLYVAY